MTMQIYMFPASCSRVTMTALEEVGVDYQDILVNFQADEQKSAPYLALNPKAKVPALRVDGRIMTENAAIIAYLHRTHPNAGLLSIHDDPVADTQGLSDLIWCAGTLHPIVRQIRAPFKWTKGDPAEVKADGIDKFTAECAKLSTRIGEHWWYGDNWSIVDTYLYWAYSTAQVGGFALDQFPVLGRHAVRVRARPSFQRALAREQAAVEHYALTNMVL